MSTNVSVARLAEAMNVTPRRVQQLVLEGLPKGKRGVYALEDCLMWYVRYLQGKVAGGRPEGGSDEISPKDRLDIAKAEQEEYHLAQLRKETLTIADFERGMSELLTPARHELLALEPKLRPIIGPEHAALVGEEVRRALRDLGADMEDAS